MQTWTTAGRSAGPVKHMHPMLRRLLEWTGGGGRGCSRGQKGKGWAVDVFYQHGGPLLQVARPAGPVVQHKRDWRTEGAHACHVRKQRVGHHQWVAGALRKRRRSVGGKEGEEGGWWELERAGPEEREVQPRPPSTQLVRYEERRRRSWLHR